MEFNELELAARQGREELLEMFDSISFLDYIQKILDKLPYFGAILTDRNQIIFANIELLASLGANNIEAILGMKPGEMLNCKYAANGRDGCGTSRNCSVCGALEAITESRLTDKQVTKECRICTEPGANGFKALTFKVTGTPFEWMEKNFTILTLIDISSEKRKCNIERAFYHDLLNKTGSIQGFLKLLKENEYDKEANELIDVINSINLDLTEEIKAQRDLVNAENNELKLNITSFEVSSIIDVVRIQLADHRLARNKTIKVNCEDQEIYIESDVIILKRILTNMLKNAIEASNSSETIVIGCTKFDNSVRFWVKNNTVIPEPVQLQIFQRYFSSKSGTRGIGTYSMKLLGEVYLKGNVNFDSKKDLGTIFYIDLPLKL